MGITSLSNPTSNSTEAFLPLSKSPIWEDARSYYQEKGVSAWNSNAVPNYITTNPFIAQSYARVINSFFEVHRPKRGKDKNDDTFYILELGAGSGRFAYHFLQSYFSNSEFSAQDGRKTIYVMTDVSTTTIDFWRRQPQLASFVADGRLDFANFDVLKDDGVNLMESGKTLDVYTLEAPIAVIANYVIDSLPHDFFSIENGKLFERLISYSRAIPSEENSTQQSNSEIAYSDRPCSETYYKNSVWDGVLRQYVEDFKDLNFAIPTGGIRMLETLSKISRKPVFVLSSDFGITQDTGLRQLGPRRIAVNGAFSIHVNFNALKRYAEMKGMSVLQCYTEKSSLETMGFIMRPGRRNLEPLFREFSRQIQTQGPDEFFMMKKITEKAADHLTPQNILGLLRLSNYDSRIYELCERALERHLNELDPSRQEALIDAVLQVEKMHYRYEQQRDPTVRILKFLLRLGALKPAQEIAHRNISFLKKTEVGRQTYADIFGRKAI